MPTEYTDIPCPHVDLRQPSEPTAEDRIAALEAQNAAMLDELAKVTTLAQLRAAAKSATRPPRRD